LQTPSRYDNDKIDRANGKDTAGRRLRFTIEYYAVNYKDAVFSRAKVFDICLKKSNFISSSYP
jgi:hypothetical protein